MEEAKTSSTSYRNDLVFILLRIIQDRMAL